MTNYVCMCMYSYTKFNDISNLSTEGLYNKGGLLKFVYIGIERFSQVYHLTLHIIHVAYVLKKINNFFFFR